MPELNPVSVLLGAGRGAYRVGRGAIGAAAGIGATALRRLAGRPEPLRGSGIASSPGPAPAPAAPSAAPTPSREKPAEAKPAKPKRKAAKSKAGLRRQPRRAADGVPVPGFPEPPGRDPGDISNDPSPHHALNNPVVDDPDPTEWPDPYEQRDDPRDPADPDGEPFGAEPHPDPGSISTSEPHPSRDSEAGDRWEGPKRDRLDS